MRRELRKGEIGDGQWEAKGEIRRGCAYDVGHVEETQRDIRRAHSWAPRRDVKSYLSLSPRFIQHSAVLRCTMHAMKHDAHARSSPIYRRPRFLFNLHWQVGTEVPKKDSRPRLSDQNDLRRRSTIVASLMFLCGRKIYIQFIFKMKRAMMSWWYMKE